MMNKTQIEAFKAIVNFLDDSERRHFISEGEPDDHIYRASMILKDFIDGNAGRQPTSPTEKVASRPNGEHPLGQAGPIGIVRDHPSHDEPNESQGPSVADIHRKMIEMRWAKESVAMAAVELNVAYAQFVITNDQCEIPTGEICAAFHRLEEAMQRLGLTDDIPF